MIGNDIECVKNKRCIIYYLKLTLNRLQQGSICETRAGPNHPKLEGVWFFVDFKYILFENRYFWRI